MGLIAYFRDRKARSAAAVRQWDCPDWWRDPHSHPDIRKMSGREVADIPVDRAFTGRGRSQNSQPRRWL